MGKDFCDGYNPLEGYRNTVKYVYIINPISNQYCGWKVEWPSCQKRKESA